MRIFGAALAAVVLFASSAQAHTVSRVVFSGGKIDLWVYATINADCTSHGVPTVRVTSGPQHGSVTTHTGLTVAYVPANWPLHDCNGRKVQGMTAVYKSEAGFVGSDYLTIDAIYSNGKELNLDFYITVK